MPLAQSIPTSLWEMAYYHDQFCWTRGKLVLCNRPAGAATGPALSTTNRKSFEPAAMVGSTDPGAENDSLVTGKPGTITRAGMNEIPIAVGSALSSSNGTMRAAVPATREYTTGAGIRGSVFPVRRFNSLAGSANWSATTSGGVRVNIVLYCSDGRVPPAAHYSEDVGMRRSFTRTFGQTPQAIRTAPPPLASS